MAQRFTDTEKWKKPWFRNLSPRYKHLWLYMLDNCDLAGVWPVDIGLASFCIGGPKIKRAEAEQAMGKQIKILSADKWLIRDFIKYQYGELSEACNPHKAVFKALRLHGLDPPPPPPNKGGEDKGTKVGYLGTLQDKNKDQDQDKDLSGRGDARGEKEKALGIYAAYPRRAGKQQALAAIMAQMASHDPEYMLKRTVCFATSPAGQAPEYGPDYRLNPKSWFEDGRFEDDPATWEQKNGHISKRELEEQDRMKKKKADDAEFDEILRKERAK